MSVQALHQSSSNGALDSGAALHFRARSMKAIVAFVALAFAWSWSISILAQYVMEQSPVLGTILKIASGFGPSIAGIAVVAYCSTGPEFRRWMRRSLNWRVGWRWYAMAFCLPPAIMVLALAFHGALGGAVPTFSAFHHIHLAIANFGLVLLVGGPLGEEFGWRGYAMPALVARWGWRTSSLLIGLVWGLWHLPLFLTAGTAQSSMSMPVFMVNILAGAVVFGWFFARTRGSVLPALVLHTSLNAWAGIFGMVPNASTGRPFALVTGMLVLVAAVLMFHAEKEPSGETPERVSRGQP
jgi:uncharacterized protein